MKAFCFTVAGILALLPAAIAAQQSSSDAAESGKQLFQQNGCYECHGYAGQGGAAGARIAPWTIGAEALISYVRHPAGQMPPYTEEVISDEELKKIAVYLKGISAGRAAKDIPLLNEGHAK